MGALVEIAAVSLADAGSSELRGAFLDAPGSERLFDAQAVDVLGWALGADRRALAAEFALDGSVLQRALLGEERPDLASAFPEHAEAGHAGFRTTLNLIGAQAEFELDVSVVLEGRRRAPLASIHGRRRWRREHSPAFARVVSIVIPCHRPTERLHEAIESAHAQSYPHVEVLVVDGASAGHEPSLASRHPGVRCASEPSHSEAEARNAGIRTSNGDFLLFLDPEHTLDENAVEAGMAALAERPECAAALAGRPEAAAFAIYRRSLFEHIHGFDPAAGAAAGLAFDLNVTREFPVCGVGPSSAARAASARDGRQDAELLADTLVVLTRASLRDRRFAAAIRHAAALARRRPGALARLLLPDRARSG